MLFNLFGKEKEQDSNRIFKDKVYLYCEGKMNACLTLSKEQPTILLIAWFEDTARQFKKYFEQHNTDSSNILLVKQVTISLLKNHVPVFVEHYPLYEKEQTCVSGWERENIAVYSAMDEPLFKHFGSDKMIPLIKLLGMKENEAIQHSYVTESIIKGQHNIANKVVIEQAATSQAKWMEINLPPTQ